MNKKELFEKIKEFPYSEGVIIDTVKINRTWLLRMIKELEPEKVKIPQFVADWIEKCKNKEKSLLDALLYTPEKVNSWVGNSENQETFAIAWIFGYEVEKEPKYTVKFKATNQYLCDDDGIGLHISPSFRSNFRKSDLEKLSLTEVFDSPLFEVEEV